MVAPSAQPGAPVPRPPLDRNAAREILEVEGPLVDELAAVPRIADWALPLIVVLTRGETGSTISPRERQLLHLQAAATNGPGPWLDFQEERARRLLSEPEVAAARGAGEEGSSPFSVREALVLRWAAAVTQNEAKRERDVYTSLCENFTEAEIVEITGAVGMSCFLDRFLRTVIPPDRASGMTIHTGEPNPLDSHKFRMWSEHCAKALSADRQEV